MKLEIKNNKIVATSETEADALALLNFGKAVEFKPQFPLQKRAYTKRMKGRTSKYATEEERKAAKKKYNRKWYKKNKAKKAIEVLGTPVAINKIEETNNG